MREITVVDARSRSAGWLLERCDLGVLLAKSMAF